MRQRRRLLSADDGARDLWPSFTDITTTIALILFVLVLLAYVRNLIAGKRLDAFQKRITTSEQTLRRLEGELRRTTAEIEAGKAQLALSEAKVHEQEEAIASANRELDSVRSQLQGIALLRVEVLEKVKRSIEAELGPRSSTGAELVLIGDNGNIVINESLLFEFNSHAIKPEAKPLLDTLARALGRLLEEDDVRENIDAILIQGHTDERGSPTFNRDLASKRANAVLDYLFAANPALEQAYGSYFASTAYSEFRPIDPGKTDAAYERNRRIELSVVLRDAHVREVIDEYLRDLGGSGGP